MITFDEAKRHLRVDHSDDDADITSKLRLAEAIVLNYLGDASDGSTNNGDSVIDAATLLVLGELYANRESHSDPLSASVKTILDRLKVPGYA